MAPSDDSAVMGTPLRVRAREQGMYAFVVREIDDVFDLARPQDLQPWMEVVGPTAQLTPPPEEP